MLPENLLQTTTDIDFCNNIINNHCSLNKKYKCKSIDIEKYIEETALLYYQNIYSIVESKGIGSLYSKTVKVVLPHLHYTSKDEHLFMISSFHMQQILTAPNFSIDNKLKILKKIISLFKMSNFSKLKKILLIGFVDSVYSCIILNNNINTKFNWRDNKDGLQIANKRFFSLLLNLDSSYKAISKDIIAINLLFVDLEKRFIFNNDINNITDYGTYIFENEWKYLERCYRSFMYLLNVLVADKHRKIIFTDLCEANAISGGFQGISSSIYNLPIKKEYANNLLSLLKKGRIVAKHWSYSSDGLSNEEKSVEIVNSINKSLGLESGLEVVESIGTNFYFKVNNTKHTLFHRGYLSNDENELINILEGNTSQAFEFTIVQAEENKDSSVVLQLLISYKHHTSKKHACEALLRIYYKEYQLFANSENILQKVTRAIKLCSLLQRIHPFSDANGRIMFFILLPVLLYQMDMWLLRTVYEPWVKLDFYSAEQLAKEIIKLCVPAPVIKREFNWKKNLSYFEDFRVSCALGDTKRVIGLLNQHPQLLKKPIFISPISSTVPLLKYLTMYNQYELIDYLLEHLNFTEVSFEDVSECLQLTRDKYVKALLLNYIKKNF
jgi:hypothetical protein